MAVIPPMMMMDEARSVQYSSPLPDSAGGLFAPAGVITALFDALPDAVWVAGASGTISYINLALRTLLDLPIEAEPAAVTPLLGSLCDADGQPLPPEEQPVARALRGEAAAGISLRLSIYY